MLIRRLLAAAISMLAVALLAVGLDSGVASATQGCIKVNAAGLCVSAGIDGDTLTLGTERDGSGAASDAAPPADTGSSDARVVTEIFTPSEDGVVWECADVAAQICTSVTRAPRISDLAAFSPLRAGIEMEPSGLAIRRYPANFIATVSPHTLTGTLLGNPAHVEFIPVGHRWDFGDGTILYTLGGGATWGDLRVDELSETETSHIYTERGEYSVAHSTIYRARFSYDHDGNWFDIAGTLSVASEPTAVRVVDVRVVLVSKTCLEVPDSIGCPTSA